MQSDVDNIANNNLITNGSAVKSVQRGVINLNGQIPSAYIPISTVDTNKAITIVSIIGFQGPYDYNLAASFTLQENQLVISKIDRNEWTAGISWQVIEFY